MTEVEPVNLIKSIGFIIVSLFKRLALLERRELGSCDARMSSVRTPGALIFPFRIAHSSMRRQASMILTFPALCYF